MTIYRTNEWKHRYLKAYYWNEYRREDDVVTKVKCSRSKFFDGKENTWEFDEQEVDSWTIDDPDMPEWLQKYL